MSDITIHRAEGTWVVRAGGAVLGESRDALEAERRRPADGHLLPPRRYRDGFPGPDRPHDPLPKKGDATYFSIVTKSTTLENAAWSYENPIDGAERIAGHIAFYATDFVAVERV